MKLLKLVHIRDHVWLDAQMRDASMMSYHWTRKFTFSAFKKAVRRSDNGFAIAALAATHRNGFVRESAVDFLDRAISSGWEIPFLLVRCNDWVEQVRRRACRAISNRLSDQYANHFLTNFSLVERLRDCHRADHSDLISQISSLLLRPATTTILKRGLGDPDILIQRASFAHLLQSPYVPQSECFTLAKFCSDPIVRLRAIQAAMRSQSGDQLRTVLTMFISDKSTLVKREALQGMVEQFPHDADDYLEEALINPHSSIRHLAQFYLRRQQPHRSFNTEYKKLLGISDTKKLVAVVAGIGETGDIKDTSAIAPFTKHLVPRVRRVSFHSLVQLGAAEVPVLANRLLMDPSPAVSKTASAYLSSAPQLVNVDLLFQGVEIAERRHVVHNCLTHIARQYTWYSAILILRAIQSKRAILVDEARSALQTWISYPQLRKGTKAEALEVQKALRPIDAAFDLNCVDSVDLMVKAQFRT